MTKCGEAVTQMRAYVREVAAIRENGAFISPHYAINTLRGYAQMETDDRMIDLSEHGTNTAQAYAYFRSAEWDKEAFLAEWAAQEAAVAVGREQ